MSNYGDLSFYSGISPALGIDQAQNHLLLGCHKKWAATEALQNFPIKRGNLQDWVIAFDKINWDLLVV